MYAPQFIVTAIGEADAPATQRFSAARDAIRMWRVGMTHAYYANTTMDLYFPTEGEANSFSQWGVYTPGQIIERSGSTKTSFSVKDIKKIKARGPDNKFTDKPTFVEQWKASLENLTDGRIFQFAYPTEKEVRDKFDLGGAYTLQNLLGTMPSVPTLVTESYLFAAEAAVERARLAEEAKHALAVKRQEAAESAAEEAQGAATAAWGEVVRNQTGTSSARARAAALRAQAEAIKAQWSDSGATYGSEAYNKFAQQYATADNAAKSAETDAAELASDLPSYVARYNQAKAAAQAAQARVAALAKGINRRTIPTAVQTYTISDGGATGYYNGVYYKAGTFTTKNGQWTGIYSEK